MLNDINMKNNYKEQLNKYYMKIKCFYHISNSSCINFCAVILISEKSLLRYFISFSLTVFDVFENNSQCV